MECLAFYKKRILCPRGDLWGRGGHSRAGEPVVPHTWPFPDRQMLANLSRAEGAKEQHLNVCFWNSIPAPYQLEKTPWTPLAPVPCPAGPGFTRAARARADNLIQFLFDTILLFLHILGKPGNNPNAATTELPFIKNFL